jgi:hypothetical protein
MTNEILSYASITAVLLMRPAPDDDQIHLLGLEAVCIDEHV